MKLQPRVATFSKRAKPDPEPPSNEQRQRSDSPGWLGTAAVEKTTEEPGSPAKLRRSQGYLKALREDITEARPCRESEGVVVAGSGVTPVERRIPTGFITLRKARTTAWGNPTTERDLPRVTEPSVAAKLGDRCMPQGDRVRESRMREIRPSSLKRAEAVVMAWPANIALRTG